MRFHKINQSVVNYCVNLLTYFELKYKMLNAKYNIIYKLPIKVKVKVGFFYLISN